MNAPNYHKLVNDMHAVYCAFGEIDGWIWVKVGISVRPAQRALQLQAASPFDLKRFVFCHIGAFSAARAFEKLVRKKMEGFRTRGEWYRFRPGDAQEFREGISKAFTEASWRNAKLKWSEIAYKDFHRDPRFDRDP